MRHLEELRLRIIFSLLVFIIIALVVYIKADFFIKYISSIFENAIFGKYIDTDNNAITVVREKNLFLAREIFSGFSTRLRLSMYISILFSTPFFIYHIIRFVFPAITLHTQRVIIISLLFSFFISIASAYFSLNYLIPFAVKTLTNKNFIPSNVDILLDYSTQILLPITLTICIVLVFQIPIILTVLMYLNVIKRKTVVFMIRPIIVFVFILSAIITPPDVITQILVALPLIVLLLFSLMLSYIFKFGD